MYKLLFNSNWASYDAACNADDYAAVSSSKSTSTSGLAMDTAAGGCWRALPIDARAMRLALATLGAATTSAPLDWNSRQNRSRRKLLRNGCDRNA